jgi:microcystin-dependent protein
VAELPQHTHQVMASTQAANSPVPTSDTFAAAGANQFYGTPSNLTALNAGTVTNVGGSQAHLNMEPFLTLGFCIALQGIFPSPT